MPRPFSLQLPLFTTATLALALAGCGGGGEQFANSNSAPANNGATNTTGTSADGAVVASGDEPPSTPGKYGGKMTFSSISDPKTFNLWVAAETSSTGAVGNLFEPLVTRNAYTLKYEPRLAEAVPTPTNGGKTYVFKLRDGLTWSDGDPLDADDVIFTLDAIYDLKVQTNLRESMLLDAPDGKGGFKRVPLKYKKLDARTVQFDFPVPYAPALSILEFAIAPKHKLEAAYKEGQPAKTKFNESWGINTDVRQIVGSGPFLLTEFKSGQRLVYKRNPRFWAKDEQGRTLPYLEQLVTLIVPDTNAATLKFRSGETDILGVQHTDYPLLKREEAKGGYKVLNSGPSWGNSFVCFNQNPKSIIAKRKPHVARLFREQKFRQAVSHAIDRERIGEAVFQGLATPMYGPESPANKEFYKADVPKFEYDPAKAKALLAELGLKDSNGNGILESDGKDIKFTFLTNGSNKQRIALLTIVTDDLRKVGLDASFNGIDFNKMISLLDAKPTPGQPYPLYDWDGVMLGFTGGPEPNDGRGIWNSSGNLHQWYPYQEKPATAWEKEIDDIFRQGAQELDPAKRKALYDRWQVIAGEQLPLVYTVVPDGLTALRSRFGNIKPASLGTTWNIEEVYDLKATADSPAA